MDTPRPVVCKLTWRVGDKEGTAVVGEEPFVIGRASGSDLVLGDESVSRSHARIQRKGDGWVIEDLGSKNGIKVNTYRTGQQQLASGDRIDLGAVRLYVDISRLSPTAEAKVVFRTEAEERGMRTGIIDMDRLDSLFGRLGEVTPAPAVEAPESAIDRTPVPDSGELLPLFNEAAQALLSCETLDETLERILELVFDNLPTERGVICLYDEETRTTDPKVMRTRAGASDEPISISSNIVSDVIQRRQALLVQDTLHDERFGGADSVIMMNIRSAMCAPLYRAGRIVGFIYVDRQSGRHPFSAMHLQALSTLAVLSAVAVEQTALRDDIRREQEMRARLARYSSPAVVEQILRGDTGRAPRGMVAEEGVVTVLFADLTGFTGLAERLQPAEVVRMLNSVFEHLNEVIFEFDGTLDKFRGDGLMAFFGAPLPLPDHAERAVTAALRMQELLGDLNAYAGTGRRLSMRIGINSGPVVVGDIGSPQRKDYTVIGDTVNIASRLESAVARPGQIVIGPDTRSLLGPGFRCTPLEEKVLKGKRQTVKPFLVVGREAVAGAG